MTTPSKAAQEFADKNVCTRRANRAGKVTLPGGEDYGYKMTPGTCGVYVRDWRVSHQWECLDEFPTRSAAKETLRKERAELMEQYDSGVVASELSWKPGKQPAKVAPRLSDNFKGGQSKMAYGRAVGTFVVMRKVGNDGMVRNLPFGGDAYELYGAEGTYAVFGRYTHDPLALNRWECLVSGLTKEQAKALVAKEIVVANKEYSEWRSKQSQETLDMIDGLKGERAGP